MKHILILDGDPSATDPLRLALSNKGYGVVEASTADEAVQSAERYDGRIDLMVADLVLRASSGIRLAVDMRRKIPDLCLLLISGYPPAIMRQRYRSELSGLPPECVEFVQKPLSPAMLLEGVEALIGCSD